MEIQELQSTEAVSTTRGMQDRLRHTPVIPGTSWWEGSLGSVRVMEDGHLISQLVFVSNYLTLLCIAKAAECLYL